MSDYPETAPPDLEELKLVLQQSPVLRALMEVAPEIMRAALQDETFQAGTVLFREGEPADRAYAIWSGCLRVQHEMGGEAPLVMRECMPGDIVGEVGLFDDKPRSATVVVAEDSRLISLSREDLRHALMEKPEMSLPLLGALSRRLRSSDEYLVAASRSVDYLAKRVSDKTASRDASVSGYPRTGLGLLIRDLSETVDGVVNGLTMLSRALPSTLDEQSLELLDLTDSHVRRLALRLERLQDWQRLASGEATLNLEPVMVGALAEEVAARHIPLARALDLRIDVRVQPGIPMIVADRELLRRMFVQLYDNAMRYAPPETTIDVEISHLFGRELRISVIDKGRGVPPDFREAIFEPFVRGLDEEVPGLGIGLAFCRAVLQVHGGQIWVEDGPDGLGSAFMIALPTRTSS
jgi:signal transduction histidine kinase